MIESKRKTDPTAFVDQYAFNALRRSRGNLATLSKVLKSIATVALVAVLVSVSDSAFAVGDLGETRSEIIKSEFYRALGLTIGILATAIFALLFTAIAIKIAKLNLIRNKSISSRSKN